MPNAINTNTLNVENINVKDNLNNDKIIIEGNTGNITINNKIINNIDNESDDTTADNQTIYTKKKIDNLLSQKFVGINIGESSTPPLYSVISTFYKKPQSYYFRLYNNNSNYYIFILYQYYDNTTNRPITKARITNDYTAVPRDILYFFAFKCSTINNSYVKYIYNNMIDYNPYYGSNWANIMYPLNPKPAIYRDDNIIFTVIMTDLMVEWPAKSIKFIDLEYSQTITTGPASWVFYFDYTMTVNTDLSQKSNNIPCFSFTFNQQISNIIYTNVPQTIPSKGRAYKALVITFNIYFNITANYQMKITTPSKPESPIYLLDFTVTKNDQGHAINWADIQEITIDCDCIMPFVPSY